MAVKLEFNTDFTRYLLSEEIHHTVKVVTENDMITCSGAILSQHSSVLHKMVTEDDELFLLNFSDVRECLLVLHGGSVDLTFDNIQDIMKFSVQFGIPLIYQQCMDWIENNINTGNFIAAFKLCNDVSKFAGFLGVQLYRDVFCHCASFVEIQGPVLFEEMCFGNNVEMQEPLIKFLVTTDVPISHFLPIVTKNICKENIQFIISLLNSDGAVRQLKYSPKDEIDNLFEKMDGITMDLECAKTYSKLKTLIFQSLFNSRDNFLPKEYTRDCIINDKLWEKMDCDKLLMAQTFFDGSSHFLFAEIILSWITAKKPSEETVRQLSRAIIPYKLNSDYIQLASKKLKHLGYNTGLSPSSIMESKFTKPLAHFVSTSRLHRFQGQGFYIVFNISCRNANTCTVKNHTFEIVFDSPKTLPAMTFTWAAAPVTVHDCPTADTTNAVTTDNNNLYFYGATANDEHLPFHTDFVEAMKIIRTGNNYGNFTIGCMPY